MESAGIIRPALTFSSFSFELCLKKTPVSCMGSREVGTRDHNTDQTKRNANANRMRVLQKDRLANPYLHGGRYLAESFD